MRKKRTGKTVAPELASDQLEKQLRQIGTTFKRLREERTTIDAFAYEVNIARSNINRADQGKDMKLSTFLKLVHGLGITPEEFFRELK